jgi:hypothetical protein
MIVSYKKSSCLYNTTFSSSFHSGNCFSETLIRTIKASARSRALFFAVHGSKDPLYRLVHALGVGFHGKLRRFRLFVGGGNTGKLVEPLRIAADTLVEAAHPANKQTASEEMGSHLLWGAVFLGVRFVYLAASPEPDYRTSIKMVQLLCPYGFLLSEELQKPYMLLFI